MSPRPPRVRKGQGNVDLKHDEFIRRALLPLQDPAFEGHEQAKLAVVEALFEGYDESRKWAHGRPAGRGFAKPEMEIGDDWRATRDQLKKDRLLHADPRGKGRILLINASPRSDNSCPGEMSKSHRLAEIAERVVKREGLDCEILDLSRVVSEYGKNIHPCKGCVSTAMSLCHWPCSCYPNYALGQVHDWMAEIYGMWTRAHGVMIISPVHYYSPPSVLKLMMDRMVCADGGNEDYTSTDGKDPSAAKKIELSGWKFPKHLAGRKFAMMIHGDAEGALQVREIVTSWLSDLALEPAKGNSSLDRYIGYYESYARGHEALDKDDAIMAETRRAMQELVGSVREYRKEISRRGVKKVFGADLDVRPK